MHRVKQLASLKAAEDGSVSATIATLNVKDHDSDVTLPGFFGTQPTKIVGAHDWNDIILGKGEVHEDGDNVIFEGRFNLDDPDAAKLHAKLKFDMENPPALVEWSYGFHTLPGAVEPFKNHPEHGDGFFLRPVDGGPGAKVAEVSPVVAGAGIGTGTLAVKGRTIKDQVSVALEELARVDESVARLLEKFDEDDFALTDEKQAVLASFKESLAGTLESVTHLLSPRTPEKAEDLHPLALLQAQYEQLAS